MVPAAPNHHFTGSSSKWNKAIGRLRIGKQKTKLFKYPAVLVVQINPSLKKILLESAVQ